MFVISIEHRACSFNSTEWKVKVCCSRANVPVSFNKLRFLDLISPKRMSRMKRVLRNCCICRQFRDCDRDWDAICRSAVRLTRHWPLDECNLSILRAHLILHHQYLYQLYVLIKKKHKLCLKPNLEKNYLWWKSLEKFTSVLRKKCGENTKLESSQVPSRVFHSFLEFPKFNVSNIRCPSQRSFASPNDLLPNRGN